MRVQLKSTTNIMAIVDPVFVSSEQLLKVEYIATQQDIVTYLSGACIQLRTFSATKTDLPKVTLMSLQVVSNI